jgi:Acetyl-CoA hydrolase
LVKIVSATSISLSPGYLEKFRKNMDQYKEKLILRPQGVSNCPEVIHRLGVIAMNGAIEADICGNVNSTHVFGRNMQNGIGGSGDFTSNGYLAIFFMPSTRKDGKVSCVVPRVSHVDHTEHDVDVILTEQGLADLRGLDPWERAEKIIDNCAHPSYKDMLFEYLNDCKKKGGHEPMDMERADEWYRNLEERGSMLG